MQNSMPANRFPGSARWRFIVVIAVGVFFLSALLSHQFHVNSEHYFVWDWRRLPWRIFWINLPLSLPFFFAQRMVRGSARSHFFALSLLWLSSLLLMVGCAACEADPPSIMRVAHIILNRYDTGFFTDARDLRLNGVSIHSLLQHYPNILDQLTGHAFNKPPGVLLFHSGVISLMGSDMNGALASGMLIGMLGALGSAAVYAFIRYFTGDRDAAFTGASFMALCPGPLIFFPVFDQSYPILTAGITILWARAIDRNRFGSSIALGLLAGLATLMSYLLALLAFFLIGYAAFRIWTTPRGNARRILIHAAVALAAFAAFYLVLWGISGFNPIATLRRALLIERVSSTHWYAVTGRPPRRLPGTIPWDFYSFAIGSGWISYVLAGYYFRGASGDPNRRKHLPIALLGIAQLVFVAVSNLVPGETWRVWMFMMPMLILPIGLELKTWSFAQRCTVYLLLLMMTVAICQNMIVRI
jgi:hypothetical protein